MLNIQEILDKTVQQRKAITECLDKGYYDPQEETKEHIPASLYYGLSKADSIEIHETLNNLSLAEILIKGLTTAGADKLVAAKLHDTLYYAAKQYDICPLIGYVTEKWEGANLQVNIAKDGTYKPHKFASGANMPEEEPQYVYATVAPLGYGITIDIGGDLLDDEQYGLVQWHVEQAGKACGEMATELALTVLVAGSDGDGTLNSGAAAAGQTTSANIMAALQDNAADKFVSNTLVCTQEAWAHSIAYGAEVAQARYWIHPMALASSLPPTGYHAKYGTLDVLINNSDILHASSDLAGAAMTACKTIVFDRNNALLTARKRWLRIENYAQPIKDIAGAVVSFRQDSVSLYNDSIYLLTEA
jgi:hypothetical protein